MARADLAFGLCWTVLGAAILVESWRMDRLEAQGINPFTIPGLVPGLLGAVLVVLGAVLAVRGARGGATAGNVMEVPVEGEAPPEPGAVAEPWRIGLALLLCTGFAGGLVGSGMPFPVAAFAFVFLAVFLFEWPERRAAGTLARGALRAGLVAAGASAAVTLVFQELFLVRLP